MPFAVVGGLRFAIDRTLASVDDDGFSDLDLEAHWFTGDPPPVPQLRTPMDLTVWLDRRNGTVFLPVLEDPVEMRGSQLRQVAPAVAASFDRLTLHASAVGVDGRAIAFVGESGIGKSTLAWELIKAGADPLSDDLLPVRFNHNAPFVPTVFGPYPFAAVCFLARHRGMLAARPADAATAMRYHLHHGFDEHAEADVRRFQVDAYHHLVDGASHLDLLVPYGRDTVAATARRLLMMARNHALSA